QTCALPISHLPPAGGEPGQRQDGFAGDRGEQVLQRDDQPRSWTAERLHHVDHPSGESGWFGGGGSQRHYLHAGQLRGARRSPLAANCGSGKSGRSPCPTMIPVKSRISAIGLVIYAMPAAPSGLFEGWRNRLVAGCQPGKGRLVEEFGWTRPCRKCLKPFRSNGTSPVELLLPDCWCWQRPDSPAGSCCRWSGSTPTATRSR